MAILAGRVSSWIHWMVAGTVCAGLLLLPLQSHTSRVAAAASAVNVNVNAALRYQRIDGFGVNANPKNWNFSNLPQAIDLLTDGLQSTLWRVDIFGKSNWIDSLAHLSAAYYPTIYESPDFQALWHTLDYLNRKGATILLSASGVLPDWMGGGTLDPSHEDDFVEMFASVVDYGRRVKGLPLIFLEPLNEPDGGAPEGPKMLPDQTVRVLDKVVARLQALGYGDVRIIAPEAANPDGTDQTSAILADPTLMAHVDHLSIHSYTAALGSTDSLVRSSAYPNRNFWVSEWSQIWTDGYIDSGAQVRDEWAFASTMTDELIQILEGGAAAALAYYAYDNVHEHCGCTAISHWGLLGLDQISGQYAPKKRYYSNAQVYRFVRAGWVRLDTGDKNPYLHVVAFFDPATNQVSVIGHTVTAATMSVQVTLSGLTAPTSLHLYETNALVDLAQLSDVPMSAGTFNIDVPADTFFTLTTIGSAPSQTGTPAAATGSPTATPGTTPSPMPTPAVTQTPTPTPTPTVTQTSTPTPSPTVTQTSTPAPSPTVTQTSTPTPSPTVSPTPTPTISPTASPSPSPTPTPASSTTPGPQSRTVTFNDLPGSGIPLNGQYPAQVLDWGATGQWYLSAPWGRFAGKSVSFNGQWIFSAQINVFSPWIMTQLTAYNGGTTSTTLGLSCPGQPTRSTSLAADQLADIATGWNVPCSPVTIATGNGWYTNFDNLVLVH